MKLYLTLEDGGLKSERVMYVNPECPYVADSILESMIDTIQEIKKDLKDEEVILEARRLTVHND